MRLPWNKRRQKGGGTDTLDRFYIKQSCLRSTPILAHSDTSVRMIHERYRVPLEKLRVASSGSDLEYIEGVPPHHPVPGKKGFLLGIISNLGWRKNPGADVKILSHLPRSIRAEYPLVLAGAVRSFPG